MNIDKTIRSISYEKMEQKGLEIKADMMGDMPVHKAIKRFTDITMDLLTGIALDKINTKSDENNISTSVITGTGSITTNVSSDGKLASPISKPNIITITLEDQNISKPLNNGNTIKLGNLMHKDIP